MERSREPSSWAEASGSPSKPSGASGAKGGASSLSLDVSAGLGGGDGISGWLGSVTAKSVIWAGVTTLGKNSGSHRHCVALQAAHHSPRHSPHRRRSCQSWCGRHRHLHPSPVLGGLVSGRGSRDGWRRGDGIRRGIRRDPGAESSSPSSGSVSLQEVLQGTPSGQLSSSDEARAAGAVESEEGIGSEPWGWTLVTSSKSSLAWKVLRRGWWEVVRLLASIRVSRGKGADRSRQRGDTGRCGGECQRRRLSGQLGVDVGDV